MISSPVSKVDKFATFANNEYSQFGEDGIIKKILEYLPNKNNWCVEFGAWDGIHLSNTFSLIKNNGYQSVLIEADKNKFEELKKNLMGFNAVLVNKFVMFEGRNTLDNILSKTKIPDDFDFLSIDIDGNDYYILDSLVRYKPKVICIEYNPTIPNEVSYIQPKDFNIKRGSSALAILNLAISKGYLLAATTKCNLILVDSQYWPYLNMEKGRLDELRDDSAIKVFAFSGYDGSIFLSKPLDLCWHNLRVSEDELQFFPVFLRRFSSDYTALQKFLFLVFLWVKRPVIFIERLRKKFICLFTAS
ncbi:FkbM family methyltransferase [Thiovibrio frasassiensis]|uniref:FkbM family methyltransferase n=1 Tax=Thiovibrio frasassiensis TaxID=2984131 RepID=A0A9X4RMC4_9BACT|nr:FkbM family methyltransferase [Thiovibrio frasassiensis]MDG4476033.1 FkbM family methyltransferase [Thiovibrio frasassiensis]